MSPLRYRRLHYSVQSSGHSGGSSMQRPALSSRSGIQFIHFVRTGDVDLVSGHPRTCWTDQLRNNTGFVPVNLCRNDVLRGDRVMRWPMLVMWCQRWQLFNVQLVSGLPRPGRQAGECVSLW